MSKRDDDNEEMKRLYEGDGLSLQQIAERFSFTKQNVHARLQRRGVKFRSPGAPKKSTKKTLGVGKEILERLYVEEKLTGVQIAGRLNLSSVTIYNYLKEHGIERRKPNRWKRKYPQIGGLKVGESTIVPRPRRRQRFQHDFYRMAKYAGVRVAVKTIDEESVRLTRVE